MIAMSCTGCRWLGLDFNFDGAILIYNDSASGIYCLCPSYDDIRPDCVSCTYPDTTICFTIRPGIGLDGGSGWYYIPAKETTTAGRPNSHMERWFSAFPQDTMSIFIFDEETVNHNSWKIIAEEYLVLQRYDLSIEDIKKLMDECRRMGISVLGPDINESDVTFTVNKEGNIRFGMAGVKGVGAAVVNSIIEGRADSPYKNIFDFIERSSAKAPVNKKTIESLAYAGAFDSFPEIRREQFFAVNSKGELFIEALCRYGSKVAADTLNNSSSLFQMEDEGFKPTPPEIPVIGETNKLEFLKKEKELTGIYLSAHPLDIYKFEMKHLVQFTLQKINQVMKEGLYSEFGEKEFSIAGLVSNVVRKNTKTGRPYATFSLEDYSGSISQSLFGKDYENFIPYMEDGQALYLRCAFVPRYQAKKENNEDKREISGYELRIRKVSLLANVIEELIKSFTLILPVDKIDAQFRKKLLKLLKQSKGKKPFNVRMLEYKEKIAVELVSRKYGIDITAELIDLIDSCGFEYSVE